MKSTSDTTATRHRTVPGRNLPARNPHFRGREEVLTGLHAALSQKPAVTLIGPAGCGKTALAVEYAHRYFPQDAVVWWLRAGDATSLAVDYALLMNALGLLNLDDIDSAGRATRRWLEAHPGWLLVFDEADDLSVVAPYLPQPPSGQVLVLSRADRAPAGTLAQPVAPSLSRAESVALLRGQIKPGGKAAASPAQTLDALAEGLGDHPLALALAGAFFRHEGGSAQEYLNLLLAQKRRQQAPPATLAIRVAMRQFEDMLSTGLLPLYLFSFLRPPINSFLLVPDHLRSASDRLRRGATGRDNVLLLLADLFADPRNLVNHLLGLRVFGLLDLDAAKGPPSLDSMDVPRALLEEVRRTLSGRDLRLWADAALGYLLAAFPDQDKLSGEVGLLAFALVADAMQVAALAEQADLPRRTVAALLVKVARFLYHFHGYHQAEQVMLRALRLAEPVEEPGYKIVAGMLGVLGDTLKQLGRAAEAVPHFERALALYQQVCAPGGLDLAVAESNLGTVLCMAERPGEARPHLERALVLLRDQGAAPQMQVACQVALGEAVRQGGDAAAARDCLQQAHALCEARGLRDRELGLVLLYLGLAWRDLGEKAQAQAHLERSLQIDERLLGREYPGLLRTLHPLIELLTERGDHEKARALAERAMSILISSGQASPGLLSALAQIQGLRGRA